MKYLRVTTDIAKQESATNLPATVLVTLTDIVTVDVGSVKTGDSILLCVRVLGTKGGVAGTLRFILNATGTAVVAWAGDNENIWREEDIQANAEEGRAFPLWIQVTTGGSLVLTLAGYSAGSNFTIAQYDAALTATVFSGSVI